MVPFRTGAKIQNGGSVFPTEGDGVHVDFLNSLVLICGVVHYNNKHGGNTVRLWEESHGSIFDDEPTLKQLLWATDTDLKGLTFANCMCRRYYLIIANAHLKGLALLLMAN